MEVARNALQYVPGDLLWAKIGRYPYWPCMVSNDPAKKDFSRFTKSGSKVNRIYHVQFFGEKPQRSWSTRNIPYNGIDAFYDEFGDRSKLEQYQLANRKKGPGLLKKGYKIKPNLVKSWNIAVEEAEEAFEIKDTTERFNTYVFNYDDSKEIEENVTDTSTKDNSLESSEVSKPKKLKLSNDSESAKKICCMCEVSCLRCSKNIPSGLVVHVECHKDKPSWTDSTSMEEEYVDVQSAEVEEDVVPRSSEGAKSSSHSSSMVEDVDLQLSIEAKSSDSVTMIKDVGLQLSSEGTKSTSGSSSMVDNLLSAEGDKSSSVSLAMVEDEKLQSTEEAKSSSTNEDVQTAEGTPLNLAPKDSSESKKLEVFKEKYEQWKSSQKFSVTATVASTWTDTASETATTVSTATNTASIPTPQKQSEYEKKSKECQKKFDKQSKKVEKEFKKWKMSHQEHCPQEKFEKYVKQFEAWKKKEVQKYQKAKTEYLALLNTAARKAASTNDAESPATAAMYAPQSQYVNIQSYRNPGNDPVPSPTMPTGMHPQLPGPSAQPPSIGNLPLIPFPPGDPSMTPMDPNVRLDFSEESKEEAPLPSSSTLKDEAYVYLERLEQYFKTSNILNITVPVNAESTVVQNNAASALSEPTNFAVNRDRVMYCINHSWISLQKSDVLKLYKFGIKGEEKLPYIDALTLISDTKPSLVNKHCFVCKKSNTTFYCLHEECFRAFHPWCVRLPEVPKFYWECPSHKCGVCKRVPMFFCKNCPLSYCNACHRRKKVSDRFYCQLCKLKRRNQKKKRAN